VTAGNVFLAACPARLAVEIIADKWAVVVLYGLADKPRRHGELARLIGSQQVVRAGYRGQCSDPESRDGGPSALG
jgi:DNA-binding HxlR family transcriptional regulator